MSKFKQIAVDGFSSSGKSTLAKDLANILNYVFIDTGAMYRAVTFYLLEHDIDISNHEEVIESLDDIHITFQTIDGKNTCFLNGKNVSQEIRSLEVSNYVSEVARIKEVRAKLVALQRQIGQKANVVMDGRDIGTVVFPDAELKFFVTASLDERVRRRFAEMQKKNPEITIEEVRANLIHRDNIDTTREHSPLMKAEDAHVIDNTELTVDSQLKLALQYYNKHIE